MAEPALVVKQIHGFAPSVPNRPSAYVKFGYGGSVVEVQQNGFRPPRLREWKSGLTQNFTEGLETVGDVVAGQLQKDALGMQGACITSVWAFAAAKSVPLAVTRRKNERIEAGMDADIEYIRQHQPPKAPKRKGEKHGSKKRRGDSADSSEKSSSKKGKKVTRTEQEQPALFKPHTMEELFRPSLIAEADPHARRQLAKKLEKCIGSADGAIPVTDPSHSLLAEVAKPMPPPRGYVRKVVPKAAAKKAPMVPPAKPYAPPAPLPQPQPQPQPQLQAPPTPGALPDILSLSPAPSDAGYQTMNPSERGHFLSSTPLPQTPSFTTPRTPSFTPTQITTPNTVALSELAAFCSSAIPDKMEVDLHFPMSPQGMRRSTVRPASYFDPKPTHASPGSAFFASPAPRTPKTPFSPRSLVFASEIVVPLALSQATAEKSQETSAALLPSISELDDLLQ